ncbi:PhoPQ-activated protein PqaA family protein [Paraburkholderia sp. SARCC-3016]|uniref:PhoPQ-activated pathogenicity-related family protein n=1 Tax=Paraburkholderia sp. SARCC-3016 TaxID=3058611 RepID=UPI002808990E|nr:PhoPQ-activated protein PqaA family protein [Paraburkholderia sp. SARCC-3016]MDQ7978120.1 PhoPQ-activated protein PqaA family protein [Paraburkholderia sp. SARCC-3016]
MPNDSIAFEDVIVAYRDAIERQPLQYLKTARNSLPGVEQHTYLLNSQNWSPEALVQPALWQHDVTLYVPPDAMRERALLVVNGGTRHDQSGEDAARPHDFAHDVLATIACETRTAVVVIHDVPNQNLVYTDDGRARAEDDSVAHSWALFLDDPARRPTLPLNVPMVAAISRAMSLAERELSALGIRAFTISAVSKRAWASWLAVIADTRIDAIVAFAADILDTREVLNHMYRSYGGAWPIAFSPYFAEHIDEKIDTTQFDALMQIVDPLRYLGTRHAQRLDVPKYIVNASGDDLFAPDNAGFYYDRLGGIKTLRMVPNASHHDIKDATHRSMTPFVNRLQNAVPLPSINTTLSRQGRDAVVRFDSSEPPKTLALWSATNPHARDFRLACGIRYTANPIAPTDDGTIDAPIREPETGWSAFFIEATYADGFVATSRTYIIGRETYPISSPAEGNAACRTIPGRVSARTGSFR